MIDALIRHDAQREDRHPREVAAGEHVVQPEHRVLGLARELVERRQIHPRRGDVVPHAIHGQQPERVQHAFA